MFYCELNVRLRYLQIDICEIGIHVSHQLLVATCHVDFLYAAQSAHN